MTALTTAIPTNRWTNGEELTSAPTIEKLGDVTRLIWRYDDFEGPDKSREYPLAVDVHADGTITNAETAVFGARFTSAGGRDFNAR